MAFLPFIKVTENAPVVRSALISLDLKKWKYDLMVLEIPIWKVLWKNMKPNRKGKKIPWTLPLAFYVLSIQNASGV